MSAHLFSKSCLKPNLREKGREEQCSPVVTMGGGGGGGGKRVEGGGGGGGEGEEREM